MEDNKRNRRRSSFFQRRHSLYIDSPTETSHSEIDKSNEEEAKITRYISKLNTEKREWKNLLGRLKKENAELKQRSPVVIDHNSSWALLTPEDRQFLQGQVDYVSLGRLLDSTAEAVALRHQRTTAIIRNLVSLVRDFHQSNKDLTSVIIYRSINHFDEFDLFCDNLDEIYKSD